VASATRRERREFRRRAWRIGTPTHGFFGSFAYRFLVAHGYLASPSIGVLPGSRLAALRAERARAVRHELEVDVWQSRHGDRRPAFDPNIFDSDTFEWPDVDLTQP